MRNSVFMEPSSERRTDWETPQDLFNLLDEEFHFTLDVCANNVNRKCERYFSPEVNGLAQEWTGVCWMNPPYGRNMQWWIQKAYDSAKAGATVVCLLPVRSNNEWWKLVITAEVRFIRKKIKFVGADHDLMVPSAIVIFRPQETGIMRILEQSRTSPPDPSLVACDRVS